ncbi:MAG: hypothetical protein V1726_01635 [Methanobacteriota archaeon]
MKNEKLAVLVLVILVVSALSSYFVIFYGQDIMENLLQVKPEIAVGDCADISYIGSYVSNGTTFDSSYNDTVNKTGGTPLHVFVSLNKSLAPPTGYEQYSSGIIDGMMNGLIGLKQGETAVIGPISPEDGYGNKLIVGDTFYSESILFGLNLTVMVTNLTSENISLYWVDPEGFDMFTLPQIIIKDLSKVFVDENLAVTIYPPFFLWENETSLVNVSDDIVNVRLNPIKTENFVDMITPYYQGNLTKIEFVFPNATSATWTNTTVTLTSSPQIGAVYPYTYTYFGMPIDTSFTIQNVTETMINLSSPGSSEGEHFYTEIDRVLTFNRTMSINRQYMNIPLQVFSTLYTGDIQLSGYSLHPLAGEYLQFEVTVDTVYKIE